MPWGKATIADIRVEDDRENKNILFGSAPPFPQASGDCSLGLRVDIGAGKDSVKVPKSQENGIEPGVWCLEDSGGDR